MPLVSAEWRAFLSAAVRSPATMGAVAPSSRGLAELLAGPVPVTGHPVVVELGPGTGAITEAIERRLPPGSVHLAVDSNPAMVGFLRRRCPGVDAMLGDAAGLGTLLAGRGIDRVDAVVSGLPWALFEPELQDSILAAVGAALGRDGVFTTFAYLHALPMAAARRFRGQLTAHFAEVVTSRTIWRNLPPAFGYRCRRARCP